MPTFTWAPDFGAEQTIKPSVLNAKFGDGYEQRVGDGINNMPRKWSVVFKSTPTTVEAVEAFLRTLVGVSSFDWLPPTGVAGKFVCDGWTRTVVDFGQHSLSAAFREVFEP